MTLPLKVNITLDTGNVLKDLFCGEVLEIIKASKPAWCEKTSFVENLESKVFSGGLANHLIAYYEKGHFDDALLVKIYGQGMDIMVNRPAENENMQILHKEGFCPPMYVIFNNGVSYGYTQGVVLDKDTARQEAVKRSVIREIVGFQRVRPAGQCERSEMWDMMYKLLDIAPDGYIHPDKHQRYKECVKSKAELRKEVAELQTHLEAVNSPVVFCHNDLLFGNIIYNAASGRVSFIDFEFAWPNYEHFELANHFCEYAGVFEMDYKQFPDRDYQREWLRIYLQEKMNSTSGTGAVKGNEDGRAMVAEIDLESCLVKTCKFTLASHMLWALCCLCRAKDSDLDFDYLGYGIQRFQEYFRTKEALFSMRLPE